MTNSTPKSAIDNLEKRIDAQRKNVLELENELEYCREELEGYKKKNDVLNRNIDLLREQIEGLETELRKYKQLKQRGDIEGA